MCTGTLHDGDCVSECDELSIECRLYSCDIDPIAEWEEYVNCVTTCRLNNIDCTVECRY
jgi:hypothetical protein